MKTETVKVNSRLFLEGFLGLLSAFGPFVMDMYLASFPLITEFYHTVPSLVQLSLATCTVGLALGQFIFGIVSDRYGRRMPLLLSLLFYLVATLGCILSPSVWMFVCMRFFQGVAAAGSVVISRSVAADCYRGEALTRIIGVIGMINGVSTVAAPVFGGLVIGTWGWKAAFWGLFVIGVVMVAGTLRLRESQPVVLRVPVNPATLLKSVKKIISNRLYITATLQYGFVMALIFVNLASGPFIMDDYGLSEKQTSLVFAANAIAEAVGAGIAARFRNMRKVIKIADMGMAFSSILLAAILLSHFSYWIYIAACFLVCLSVGAICTGSTTIAMESERNNAGMASAFFGAVGYVAGGLSSPIVGIGNIYVTSSVLFVLFSTTSLISAYKGLR